jgi:hypothetical protein
VITLVRSGRTYPTELGLLLACAIGGIAGLLLGPFVPPTTSHIGPAALFYGLVTAGGVVGLGGIGMAVVFKASRPQAALWGVNLERAAMVLVGTQWSAYGLAIVGSSGLRGVPVAVLLAGIGGGCLGRALQITGDFRKARRQIVADSAPRRSDGSTL